MLSEPASPPRADPDPALVASRRREIAELRETAHRLRLEASALPDLLRTLQSYDRPDVWTGRRADHFRMELLDVARRVTSPGVGALTGLAEAAARLEGRAAALDATIADQSW
jgi:hypothetical protein